MGRPWLLPTIFLVLGLLTSHVSCQDCGGTFTNSTGVITSPNYPDNYPANTVCEYLIQPPDGKYIMLHFTTFWLEELSLGSCYDYLQIREGNSTNSPIIANYCEKNLSDTRVASQNPTYLKFYSDGTNEYQGFRATYTTEEENCGGQYTSPTGVLKSPFFPDIYPIHLRCEYIIIQPEGTHITLYFSTFDTESHENCSYDYLEIREGNSSNSPLNGTYCGNHLNDTQMSFSQHQLYLKFFTDFSIQHQGFMATYTTERPDDDGGNDGDDGEEKSEDEKTDGKETDESCSIAKFKESFVQYVEASLYTMVSSDKINLCRHRQRLEGYVQHYLQTCEEVNGDILTALLRPYPAVFEAITGVYCDFDDYGRTQNYDGISRAIKCMVDYTKTAVQGSFIGICKQGKTALRCVEEATHSCADREKNMFSMVTDIMTMTMKSVCGMESCNLGMAEQCLKEGYAVNGAQLYREHGSKLSCSGIVEALTCAANHIMPCALQYEELDSDWLDELDGEDEYSGMAKDMTGDQPDADREEIMNRYSSVEHTYFLMEYLEMVDEFQKALDISENSRTMDGTDISEIRFHEHVDNVQDRVETLLEQLDDGSGSGMESNNMHEMLSMLWDQYKYIQNEINMQEYGINLQRNIKRLKNIQIRIARFVEELELPDMSEEETTQMKENLEMLRGTVNEHLEAEMMKLRERLYHVRDSLMYLHSRLGTFCNGTENDWIRLLIPKDYQIFHILANLITSPFSDGKKVCRLVEIVKVSLGKVRRGEMKVTVDLEEYIKSAYESLMYIDIIMEPVCREEMDRQEGEDDHGERNCTAASDGSPICNLAAAIECVNYSRLDVLVNDVQYGLFNEDPKRPCRTGKELLVCIHENIKDCVELPDKVEEMKNRVKGIVPAEFECEWTIQKVEECEQEPECSPREAALECFEMPDITSDVCRFIELRVIQCIHNKMEACKYSADFSIVQALLNDYIHELNDRIDDACILQTDLLLDDITRSETECNVDFYLAWKRSFSRNGSGSFNSTLCEAMAASYECEKNQYYPYIVRVFREQHAEFYAKLWESNCEDKEGDIEMDGEGADNEITDLMGCRVTEAIVTMGHFMGDISSSWGILAGTDKYRQNCSEAAYNETKEKLMTIAESCKPVAAELIKGSFPFLKSFQKEYCVFPLEPEAGICSVDEVKKCVRKFGMHMALASPYEEICRSLQSSLECVADSSVNCDNESKTEIDKELQHLHRILGNADCGQPSWCEADMEGADGDDGESGEEMTGRIVDDQENLPFCMEPSLCSIQWHGCLEGEKTCEESVQCIEDVAARCPDALKLVIRMKIQDYENSVGMEENSCSLVPQSLTDLESGVMDSCLADFAIAYSENHESFCTNLRAYVDCISMDLENEIPAVEMGRLKASTQIYGNFLMDFCQIFDDGREGENSDNEMNDDVHSSGNGTETNRDDSESEEGHTDGTNDNGDTDESLEGDTCDQLMTAKKHMKNVAKMVLLIPYTPIGDRTYLCEAGTEEFDIAEEVIKGCKNDESKGLGEVSSLIGTLVDTMGFCSRAPVPRICNPDIALNCLSDLSQSLVDNQGEFVLTTCSDVLSVENCVFSNTLGCDWLTRYHVEHSALVVLSGVHQACMPKPEQIPDLSCMVDHNEDYCDISGAASCLVKMQTALMCDRPDWDEICPSVPYVSTCLVRNLQGCGADDRQVFDKLSSELMKKVKGHCPEVECDVCGAHKCLQDLEKMKEDDNYCWYAMEAESCVKKMTKHCGEEYTQEIWMKIKSVTEMVEEQCTKRVYTCLDDFRYTAFSLLTYSGPTVLIEDTDHTGAEDPGKSSKSSDKDSTGTDSPGKGSMSSNEDSEETISSGKSSKSSDQDGKETISSGKSSKSSDKDSTGTYSPGKDSMSSNEDSKGTISTGKSSKSSDQDSKGTISSGKSSKSSDKDSTGTNSPGKGSMSSNEDSKEMSSRSKEKSKGTTEESEKDVECDMYYYEDEPWSYDDAFGMGLTSILDSLMGAKDEASEDEDSDTEDSESSYSNGKGSSTKSGEDNDSNTSNSQMTETGDDDDSISSTDSDSTVDYDRRRKRSASEDKNTKKSASSKQSGEKSGTGSESKDSEVTNDETSKSNSQVTESETPENSASTESGDSNPEEPKVEKKCLLRRVVPIHPRLYGLCYKLHMAWQCLESHAFMMDESIAEPVKATLYMVMQAAKQKCSVVPLQCHSCHKADSEDKCDAQEIETCDLHQRMCQTITRSGKNGYISKGCVNPKSCEESCKGNKCVKCCDGPFCNKMVDGNSTVDPPNYCNIHAQTYCAVDLAAYLIKEGRMNCKQYFEAMECMSKFEEACYPNDMSRTITLVTNYLKKSRSWISCVTKARDCNCGGHAVISMENVYLNPYTSHVTGCMHFGSVYEMVRKTDWDRCMPSDHEYFSNSVELFWSTRSTVCLKVFEETDTPQFCPLPTSYMVTSTCPSDCESDEDCSNNGNMTKCCNNGCGGMSCVTPVEVDPMKQEPKAGYCPEYLPGEISICPVECSVDSQCSGTMKCCDVPCGGPLCVEPSEMKPLAALECGDRTHQTNCLANPCENAQCPNYEQVECRTAYCGGCHAQFILDGEDITSLCEDPEPVPECSLDKAEGTEGPCEDQDAGQKYFFNAGTCMEFDYAGCGGNENRFDTWRECNEKCKPRCSLPMNPADCNTDMPSWYYDTNQGKCREFNFSGCGGNANRFLTEDQCLRNCGHVKELESDCEMARTEVNRTVVSTIIPMLEKLPEYLKCSFLENDYKMKVETVMNQCRLISKIEEITLEAKQNLNFNWSVCKVDDKENEEEEEEEETEVCSSLQDVQTQCTLPEIVPEYDCQKLKDYVACVLSITKHCNLFSWKKIRQPLHSHLEQLKESSITCEVELPPMKDDRLYPILECALEFKTTVLETLINKFVPYGQAMDMCYAADEFRHCIYTIPDLPAKFHVSKMLGVVDKVHKAFCSDISLPTTGRSSLECYVCTEEEENEACNNRTEICKFNEKSCMTRVNIMADSYTISKGCAIPETTQDTDGRPALKNGQFYYQYLCHGQSLCNEPMRLDNKSSVDTNDTMGEGDSDDPHQTDSDDLVEPSENCLYLNIKDMVDEILFNTSAFLFLHFDDQSAYCGGFVETTSKSEAMIGDCSEDIKGRVNKLFSAFGDDINTHICPQPINEEKEECSWIRCFDPIIPYIRTNGAASECVNVQRAFDCLVDLSSKCTYDERIAIVDGVLSVLSDVKGSQYCGIDLNETICSLSKVDPLTVCDLDEAEACLSVSILAFDSDTVKCQKRKMKFDCVTYYATNCPESSNRTDYLAEIEADKCDDPAVMSTFSPPTCKQYSEDLCMPFQSVNESLKFIRGFIEGTDVNAFCQEADIKKFNATSIIEGCSDPLAAVPLFTFFRGVGVYGCSSSSLILFKDTPWKQCVQSFMAEIWDSFSTAEVGAYCSAIQKFSTCLADVDSFTMETVLLKDELEWIMHWANTCKNETEDPVIPTQDNCRIDLASHCVISYGMLYTLSPLMPDSEKTKLCSTSLTQHIDFICASYWASCDTENLLVARLFELRKNFTDFAMRLDICEEPEEPVWPEPKPDPDPEAKCEPSMAMDLISKLGLALSKCIHEPSLKHRVCRSIHATELEVNAWLSGCVDVIQSKVHSSWHEMAVLVDKVCSEEDDSIDLPQCVVYNYYNPREKCRPSKALLSLMDLEERVFAADTTEERFCGWVKHTVKYYLDYTSNCDYQLRELLNPWMERLLGQFSGRCPDIWCPVIIKPDKCDVEAATVCMKKLTTRFTSGEDYLCQLAEETKVCILKANVDCDVEGQLMLSKMMASIQVISSTVCLRPEPEVIDAAGCLENLVMKIETLLDYRYEDTPDKDSDAKTTDSEETDSTDSGSNDDDSGSDDQDNTNSVDSSDNDNNGDDDTADDNDSDGYDDGGTDSDDNDDGGNDANGDSDDKKKKRRKRDESYDSDGNSKSDVTGDETASTVTGKSKDTVSISKKSLSKKSTASKETANSGSTASQISSGSRGSLVNEKSRVYEDKVVELCQDVEWAWMCVEDSLKVLDKNTRSVLSILLRGLWMAVQEKCKPHHCYSCVGLADNDDCLAQDTCSCGVDQQMCYSYYEGGKYTKGCSESCKECEGKVDCYCCQGRKCNGDDTIDPEDKCEVSVALTCAFELFSITISTDSMTYSAIQGKVECILEHTKGCKSYYYRQIYSICLGIIDVFEFGKCAAKFGNPVCGTSSISSLGYILKNKFSDKMAICSQLEATSIAVDLVIDEEICTEEEFKPISASYDYASTQLAEYCSLPEDNKDPCDIPMAINECFKQKSWRVPADSSECSEEMFQAFKQCCIKYTKGCNSLERSGIFLSVEQHIFSAISLCLDRPSTDLNQLRADIFLVDEYSTLTSFYSNFVLNIQQSITVSLNFNESVCNSISDLVANLTALDKSPLLDLYISSDIDEIVELLSDVCKNTTIGENEVKEECELVEMDMIFVIDGSKSVKWFNFIKVREFTYNVTNLAQMENGNVRIGAVQFAGELYDEFFLNDFTETVDGVEIQDKEAVKAHFKNMTFENGLGTATGDAIEKARTFYLSENYGARQGVARNLLVITDGRSNRGTDVGVQASITHDQGIHIIAVGVAMRGNADDEAEMLSIASDPASQNYVNVDDFDNLKDVFAKIFLQFCRVDTPSECNFTQIINELTEVMMLSFTKTFSRYENKTSICSIVSSTMTSVSALSVTCAPYQQKAIQVMEKIVTALTWKTCLTVQEEPDQSCNLQRVGYCIGDSIQFLRTAAVDDDTVCSVASNLVQCLDYYAISCTNKTSIMREISFFTSIDRVRCPEVIDKLQCWGQILDDTTMDEEGDGEPAVEACDLNTIATDCLDRDDLEIMNIDFSEACIPLVSTITEVMKCARDKFVAATCERSRFSDLMTIVVKEKADFESMYEALQTIGCSMPEVIGLPEGYGVEEEPECTVIQECDVKRVKECIDNLAGLSSEDCTTLELVKLCLVHIEGCGALERVSFMSQLRMSLMERGFSGECLNSAEISWRRPDGYSDSLIGCIDNLVEAITNESKTVCEAYKEYFTCLDAIEGILAGPSLYGRQYDVVSSAVMYYCQDPVETEEDEDCSVTSSDMTCIAKYTELVATGLGLSRQGKMDLCGKHEGKLECAENIGSECNKGTPAGRLWTAYQIAEVMVFAGDMCAEKPYVCSLQTAMSCISGLGQGVSIHNYLSADTDRVCSQLTYTRHCLKMTLAACDYEEQTIVMATFKEIECLALDICVTGKYEVEEPEGEPAECIDRYKVTEDYDCNPYMAMYYLREYWHKSADPFLPPESRRKAACLGLSTSMHGVYKHIYNCGPIETGLIDVLAEDVIAEAYELGCTTEFKTPCQEVPDCGSIKARACITQFIANLHVYENETEGSARVCLEQEAVRRCIDANIESCSERVKAELEIEYNIMLTNAVCEDNFESCATEYIHYLYKILDWKAYVAPEEPETISKPETMSTDTAKSENTKTKKSEETADTKTEKSQETSASKTKDSKEDTASKTKESEETTASKTKNSKEDTASKTKESEETTASKTKNSKEDTASKTKDSKEDTASKTKKSEETTASETKKSEETTASKTKNSKEDTASKTKESEETTASKTKNSKEDTASKTKDSKEDTASKTKESEETTASETKKSEETTASKTKNSKEDTASKTKESEETTASKTKKSKETSASNTVSKTKSKSEDKPTTEEVVDEVRLQLLEEYCLEFSLAWSCIEDHWESVEGSVRGFVQTAFRKYHDIAHSICRGPRPGYCKTRTGDFTESVCTADSDCGSGYKKCCSLGSGHICVDPDPIPDTCFVKFVDAVHSSTTLVQSLYEVVDNGILFCSLSCSPSAADEIVIAFN